MASATSSRAAEAQGRLQSLAALDARLQRVPADGLPVLVVRIPELERVAWRRGLRPARSLERRASAAFSAAAARVLRSGDAVGHDAASDVFVAALIAPTRGGTAPAPLDARSALARIAATMEATARLDVVTGWTTYARSDAGKLEGVVERALICGAQERERYAFFSALGHELRTPLASIRGYLETLLEDTIDAPTRRRFVRIAYAESLRLARLVEGMFEISLLDLHATFPSRSTAILNLVLGGALDACAATAAARGVAIEMAPVPNATVALEADRLMLVMINVLDNAIKHGRAHGRVQIGVELADARTAVVRVDDDGPGVAAEDRERIFTLGERGPTRARGTGIGLALVRLMLERAGGRVDVETSPLGGARFALAIPRR